MTRKLIHTYCYGPYDQTTDLEECKRWQEGQYGETMPHEQIADLAANGFSRCEDSKCLSRKYSGDDACHCVRTIFPRPEFYELYTELRYLVLEAELMDTIKEVDTDYD
jgi:hypothetical protein